MAVEANLVCAGCDDLGGISLAVDIEPIGPPDDIPTYGVIVEYVNVVPWLILVGAIILVLLVAAKD